jgi:hypothetical protein
MLFGRLVVCPKILETVAIQADKGAVFPFCYPEILRTQRMGHLVLGRLAIIEPPASVSLARRRPGTSDEELTCAVGHALMSASWSRACAQISPWSDVQYALGRSDHLFETSLGIARHKQAEEEEEAGSRV